jgi:hypothetical protein
VDENLRCGAAPNVFPRNPSNVQCFPSGGLKTRGAAFPKLATPASAGTSPEEIAMNRRLRFAAVLLTACIAPAFAQEGAATLPSVRVTGFVADCASPRLPTQRQVEAWTGLHNFGQVYAARERLMAGIGRACQGRGVDHVQVVMHRLSQGEPRLVAMARQVR